MKLKRLKRKLSALIIAALTVSALPCVNVGAFYSGYNKATELTTKLTGYFTSATQYNWYKFTLTDANVPTTFSVSLQVPEGHMYNFDLWYREASSTGRPKVYSNETFVTGSGTRGIYGVLTDPGTYFIRVYSQDGSYGSDDSDTYKINRTISNSSVSISYDLTGFEKADTTDWSVCADLAGKKMYSKYIKKYANDRNYKKAYAFVTSNGTSDNEYLYDSGEMEKVAVDKIAEAADFVFAGDEMVNKKFVVERNHTYDIQELARYMWQYRQPIILALSHPNMPDDEFENRYVVVTKVNLADNTISYFSPMYNEESIIDFEDFSKNGIKFSTKKFKYNGTNIIPTWTRTDIQAIFK